MIESRLPKPRRVPRKHRAKPEWVELGGKRFYARSQLERREAERLEMLKVAGAIVDWLHEPKTFYFPDVKRGKVSYKPDFEVFTARGIHYVEVKGRWDRTSVQAQRLMARHFPWAEVQTTGAPMSIRDRASIEAARALTLREQEVAARKAKKGGAA